jgi:hypothetical protein
MISFTAVSASIGGALDAEIRNVNGGMIHSAATVDFTIFDGNLATGSDLLLDIANRRQAGQASGGSIGTDASVSLNVSGDLTVQGNATLQILNDHIDTAGTTASSIGGNAFVSLSAANISASANSSTGSLGILNLFITNSNGGNIGGGAILTVGATTVSTADAFNVRIFNDGGSRIGAAANSSVSISGDVTAPGGVVVDILNGASTIGSTANIFFSAGNVTSGNNTFFDMLNENGTIQLGAEVDVFATNISSTGSLNTYIDSNNGHIGGAAAVVFASQDISSTGDTFFDVLNQGGSIASTASVNVSVNSATAGGILTANVRNQGGTIGSDALLTFSSAANLQSNTAFFEVLNSGGAIHGNATDFVSAANIVATTGYNQIIDNQSAGVIDGSAGVTLHTGDLMTTSGGTFLQILNQNGGSIGSAAGITFLGSNVNTTSFNEVINNQNGGIINGSASVLLNLTGDLTASGDVFLQILKQSTSGSSVINGDASVLATVGNVSSAGSFLASIYNNFVGAPVHGSAAVDISTLGFSVGNPLAPVSATVEMTNIFGTIDQSASVGLDASGPINVNGDLAVQLFNGMANSGSAGGHIGVNANVGLSGSSISVTGTLTLQVDSTASFIGGNASVDLTSSGNISAGDTTVQIISSDNGLGQPGEIDGFANITIVSDADLTASSLFTFIDDRHAGIVGTAATIGVQLAGALNTASDAILGISTQNGGSGGGTIGSDATVNLQLGSSSVGGVFESFISTNGGGLIQGNAGISMVTSADLSATQGIAAFIADTAFGPNGVLQGGSIGGNALVTLHGQNITTPSTATGIPGTDLMALEASIYSNAGGAVGGSAIVDVSATNQISAPGTALFWVANGNYQSIGPGQIGDDARVSLTASSISTGDLLVQILNYGGSQIGNNADVNISTNSLSVNGNLDSQIDNGNAGQIGGHAVINASVANTATVSGDASFQIFGSDGAASAAINFNGGAYTVGGNFRAVIDGAGTIGLNTASIQADVLKVGVFGDNGTLTVGGGSLNANTLLKLYAPGSNGVIDFVANVTLTSQGSAAVIAANTVTIENSVVVTITGSGGSALVYTNVPNYSGPGGNGTTSGTFGGNGATTSPLPSAPPFDASSDKPSGSTTTASNPVQGAGGGREEIATSKFHGNSFSAKPHNATATTSPQPTVTAGPSGVRVADTNQLLDMLNQAGPTGSTTADGTAPGKKNGSRRQRDQLSRRASADQSTRMNRARDERLRFPIR